MRFRDDIIYSELIWRIVMKIKRILLALLFALLCAALLMSCGTNENNGGNGTTSGDGDAVTADGSEDQTGDDSQVTTDKGGDTGDPVTDPDKDEGPAPESVIIGKVRVQLLSDTLVRVEQKTSKGFEDRASFSVAKRNGWDKVEYTQTEEDSYQVITTSAYKVYVPDGASNITGVYITDLEGKELWHYESLTNSNVFLPSPSDELSCWYFSDSPRVIPSENGYSIDEDGYVRNNGWETNSSAQDMFIFLPQGDYKTFTSDFVKLTGRSEMVTLNLLGYWDSRWYAYSTRTAINQIKEYQKRGYSIDVLVIDTDWRNASSGSGYDINTSLFPDLELFMQQAHELGVTIVFNDHPEPASRTTSLLDEKEIEYRSTNLKMILALGLDYWWYDRNWSVALNPIADGISIYASGMYAFQFITEEYYESITDLGEYARRGLIMANVDGINNGVVRYAPELAAHRYTLQWTGDINTNAEALQQEIYDLIYGGVELGIPYMSSDIGGHTSEVSPDMYVRWVQYGSLSNFMRVHCTKPYSRMPWLYGDTAESVTKEYVGMRYRLLPLFYELAYENYNTGLPIMRRLDINYPQYVESDANDQYLLGDYILIAPISGAKETTAVPDSWLTHDGAAGLTAQYYRNSSLSGTPATTRIDSNINFNWTTGGPSVLGLSDNFSIRWTGQITAGEENVMLRFYADDGIKVWIDDTLMIDGWDVYDQYLYTDILEAGKTYDIKVEYCELGGNAHVNMEYTTKIEDDRTVFIPDGSWIDVWSGEKFTGPTTIEVVHPLETSPIFVREGALIALAENMVNTSEKNWSNMTLDVYPSKDYSAKTTIYEDDATTVAYKDGKYRTTDISMEYTDALTIDIAKTVGSFTDEFRGFTERTFNVRIHAREDFGSITKITLNGEEITAEVYDISESASPFAFTGASRDSVIYEISFKTDIYTANQIKVWFEHPVDDGVNGDYDDSAVDFKVTVEKITKQSRNISGGSDLDWALFGYSSVDSVVRKADGEGLIGTIESDDDNYGFSDNYTISWSGGDTKASGSSTNGPVSNRNFKITLKTVEGKMYYTLYIGGWKGLAKITVRDRAGSVQTLSFGDINTNYYRMVTIECESESASELYVNYSILCGENITFSAVMASTTER